MTFKQKDITQVPGVTPDVEIFFHGQLLLRSEDEVTCEVAVNSLAGNHVLTVEARTKIAGRPDPIIRMRHVGPLLFRRQEGMLIEVTGAGPAPAAFKCIKMVGGVPVPIDYTSGASDPPDEDFRWILNLEGPQFHRRDLDVPIFNSQNTIRLRGGEYYFRTAQRADDRIMTHTRKDGGQGPLTFRRIGVVARASVFLANGQFVQLRWQASNVEGDASVVLEKAANTTHEIYINNAPLFLKGPSATGGGEFPQFDELPEYYKLITNVTPSARFQLVPTFPPRPRDTGSPDIPCQVQQLDGPSND